MFIRSFHVVEVTNIDGEHYGAVFGTLRSMKTAINMFTPDEVYVIMDGPNSGLKRKLQNKNYKANRKKEFKKGVVKAYDFLNENDRDTNFSFQLGRLSEYLGVLPIKVISIPYVEADDIIAEIVGSMEKDCEAIIYSTDADFKQLVNERVSCYNPTVKMLTNEKAFFSKHGYLPGNHIYFKCLNGDKSDGISGVKGIGEKTYLKMFPIVSIEKIENVTELVNMAQHALDSGNAGKMLGKYQVVVDNQDLIQANWELMQLTRVNISLQAKKQIDELVNSKPQRFNDIRLRMMFLGDKLNHQVKYYEDWEHTFSELVFKQRRMKHD